MVCCRRSSHPVVCSLLNYVLNLFIVFILFSVSNGIGVFDFSNNKQSFALQCCLDVHCIKCHISVRKQVVHDKDLWQQRQDLFSCTKKIIDDVHKYYIGNTRNPVACIECPHCHDKEYTPGPHIFLDTIRSNTQCTVVNEPIAKDTYKLLLEPTDQSGTQAHYNNPMLFHQHVVHYRHYCSCTSSVCRRCSNY